MLDEEMLKHHYLGLVSSSIPFFFLTSNLLEYTEASATFPFYSSLDKRTNSVSVTVAITRCTVDD